MNSKSLKTKENLIEVARELFAQHGKNNVTMNSIAEASGKGRRTLYTYFKNKEDVYKAVVGSELDILLERLYAVLDQPVEPLAKMENYVRVHLDAVKKAVERNGTLRADFFHDIFEVERTRRKIDLKEIALISQILRDGAKSSAFKPMTSINLSANIIFYALKGVEIPYIRKVLKNDFQQIKEAIVDLIISSIQKKENKD